MLIVYRHTCRQKRRQKPNTQIFLVFASLLYCVFVAVCACVCLPQSLTTSSSETGSPAEPRLMGQPALVMSPPCLCLPSLGRRACHAAPGCLCECSGAQLRSSCLHGKHLYQLSHPLTSGLGVSIWGGGSATNSSPLLDDSQP